MGASPHTHTPLKKNYCPCSLFYLLLPIFLQYFCFIPGHNSMLNDNIAIKDEDIFNIFLKFCQSAHKKLYFIHKMYSSTKSKSPPLQVLLMSEKEDDIPPATTPSTDPVCTPEPNRTSTPSAPEQSSPSAPPPLSEDSHDDEDDLFKNESPEVAPPLLQDQEHVNPPQQGDTRNPEPEDQQGDDQEPLLPSSDNVDAKAKIE